MTEQTPAGNVAEYYRIPLAALHFFPPQILQHGSLQQATPTQSDRAQRRALGLPDGIHCRAAVGDSGVRRNLRTWAGGRMGGYADRRPFVGALTLQLPTDADDEVLSWIAAGSPPVYFGFGSMPVPAPADTIAVISAACARIEVRALICMGPNNFARTLFRTTSKLRAR